LTLITAPAGYGKTTALVDFARHTAVPVCWYTVDERDRDLTLFIRYLIGAIRERFPGFGDRTREAVIARSGDLFREPTAVVGDLVNEILDLDTTFVLVIDNFEPVDGALGIREFFHRLLEVLPSNCRLMMGSRVLPDVPVTRLVAKRQLVGLTERELRFEPEEIRGLLQLSGVEVSESRARAIARNSEGWITGILLVLDLVREDTEAAALDVEIATSQTYGYLASEVLSRQPWEVQRFLQTSSVLHEMSDRLCRSALGIDRARALLAEVERRNLFVTRFGNPRTAVYRYHDLFRGFLQERLRQQDPARYAELHQQAAVWFEQEHQVEEAVHHYLAAEAFPRATTLMEVAATECFHRGRLETLCRWMESLPEPIKPQAPRLLLYCAKVLTDRYDYQAAREILAYAEAGFSERGDGTSLARVHNQKATLGLFEGRHQQVIEEAHLALEILDRQEKPERAQAQRMIGNAEIDLGRFEVGVAQLERALTLYRQIGSSYDVLNLLQDLAFAFAGQGRFDRAASYLGEALPLARRLGAPAQLADVLNNLGWIHYARGRYREALKLYEEGLTAARRGNDPRSQANIAEGMATVHRDLGDYRRADFLYDVAWRIVSGSRPAVALLILARRVDMYRWQGDSARASTLLERAAELAGENGLDAERDRLVHLGRGIVLAERGDIKRGLQLLSNTIRALEDQGAKQDLARGHLFKAKAHLLAQEEPQALAELRRALELAREMGTAQFAVVEGQRAPELLELGVAAGVEGCRELVERAEQLRVLSRELVQGDRGGPDGAPQRLEIYALGEGRVVRGGRPVSSSEWQAAMAKELFFYILLHGPVERDVAGAVFWPDLPADKVTNNFHSTLYRVRQAVGSDAVVLENGRYVLGTDYWFDVHEFEALIERARLLPRNDWQAHELWRRAVELHRGDFLPEVDRAWCVTRRERIHGQYLEALIELGRCCEARGALEEAISWYRRVLEEDELREDIHRSIIRAYAELGRRSDALAQYRDCQEILSRELNVEPSPETKRLCEEVAGVVPG
jgi:ATP/maltotriose-dependent transcriptional regulator MalT/DNA-binding SARP family transcriptional activator